MDGGFSVRTAYRSTILREQPTNTSGWAIIWDNPLPPRIQHFLWLARRQRLLTNTERVRRCMTDESDCVHIGPRRKL